MRSKWKPTKYDVRFCGPAWPRFSWYIKVGRFALGAEWHCHSYPGQITYHVVRIYLFSVALCWSWDSRKRG